MGLYVIERFSQALALGLDLVGLLKVQPECRGGLKVAGKAQGGVGRNADILLHDALDPRPAEAKGFRQLPGGDAERDKVLLPEKFTRMQGGGEFNGHGGGPFQ